MEQKHTRNIEQVTSFNQELQNKLLRLFARVDITTKLKILKLQKLLFHRLKSKFKEVSNEVLTLSSLILAIDKSMKNLDDVNFNTIKLRGKNERSKIKRERLLGYWAIVRQLKLDENLSFRDIATYFEKYHRFEVSYSTIYLMWSELENNINLQGEKNGTRWTNLFRRYN